MFSKTGGTRETAEEIGTALVGCDSARNEKAKASARTQQADGPFGEDRVEVGVALTHLGIESTLLEKVADPDGGILRQFVFSPKGGILGADSGDGGLAVAGAGEAGDFGRAGGEELVFLELDSFPRWIPHDGVEPAIGVGLTVGKKEDVREFEVPVEWEVLGEDFLGGFGDGRGSGNVADSVFVFGPSGTGTEPGGDPKVGNGPKRGHDLGGQLSPKRFL